MHNPTGRCASSVIDTSFASTDLLSFVQPFKMRPSLSRLVRVLPRSTITRPEHGHSPPKIYDELPKSSQMSPSLLEVLLKEKELAGSDYPPNIRIETPVSKKTFAGVKRELVAPLKAVLRER